MESLGWIALSLTGHIGLKTLRALLAHFGSTEAVFAADEAALRQVSGIGPKIAASIRALDVVQISRAVERWQAAGISIIPASDPLFPEKLRLLPDAPAVLFARGQAVSQTQRAVAVVGTRQPSAQGAKIAADLGAHLAERGCTVVSGLALGVDCAAHEGALRAGRTLAVLGCGVLRVYPPQHEALAERICQQGALISEVAPDVGPSSPRLVARNRLISGLSDALIVVETSAEGGAMHAARRAREQGRPLYVLDSPASGNRALLAAGARPFSHDLHDLDVLSKG